jgi:uncharacterized protein
MPFRRKKSALGEGAAVPLLVGGVAVAAAEIGRRVYRRNQLFCPEKAPVKSWNPEDYGIPKAAVEEHWIETPDGEQLYAWYCRSAKPVASAVFCHGNTGNLTVSADIIPHLLDAGLSVLFFDYRGFGRSSGSASLGGVISDGITASRFHEQIRPKALPSVLYGFSLGGAVAAQVIRRHPFDALILQSTFTSLPAVTRHLFPRLPLHLLSGRVFDTVGVIKRLQVPLLVLHGTNDETCPSSMANEIFEACPSAKRIHTVEGGLHKDLYLRDPDALIWGISQFIADLRHGAQTVSVEPAPAIERFIDTTLRVVRSLFRRKQVIASAAAHVSRR